MVLFLLFLCVLSILPVCSIFEGTCPRKDPPSGVLVVTPGSSLTLTCSGDVKVNGAKVILTGSSNNKTKPASVKTPASKLVRSSRSVSPSLQNTVSEKNLRSVARGNGRLGYSETAGRTVGPTSISRTTGDSDWEEEEKSDHEDKEGMKVTRDVTLRYRWQWSKLPGQKGEANWGEIRVISQEDVLSLNSVAMTDTGKYMCYRRGEEMLAVEVIVADPPENPILSCYKKSPSSKIRCDWKPQKPVIKHPDCHLFLNKGQGYNMYKTEKQIPCSYSSQHSQCWCAMEHVEDERRMLYTVSLCVTSILGNATSSPTYFKPLDILKPDPPSNITAKQEEGCERKIEVTWNLPQSWMLQDSFYRLLYEIRYRPVTSAYEQVHEIENLRSYTITDALPGDKYLIRLRAKEEYDGAWSEWSSPVYTRSWKGSCAFPAEVVENFPTPTPTWDTSGSGFTGDVTEGPKNDTDKMLQYVFWISGLFTFFSAILAIYIFRHKDNLFSKHHKLIAITWCGDLSPPSPRATAAPKGEKLATFVPQLYEKRPPSDIQEEEENEEEQSVTGWVETMNFNNTSYFFLQSEM